MTNQCVMMRWEFDFLVFVVVDDDDDVEAFADGFAICRCGASRMRCCIEGSFWY